jgi:ABC-2 type transport system ATP-binding protein
VTQFDEPLTTPVRLDGVHLESSSVDGCQITFSLDGTATTAGELVAALAGMAPLRDISITEPAIEDVIARLYASPAPAPRSDRSGPRSSGPQSHR